MNRFINSAIMAVALLMGPSAHAGFVGHSIELFTVTDTDNSFGAVVVGAHLEYQPLFDFIDIWDNSITVGNKDHVCEGVCPEIGIPLLMAGDFFGFRLVDHLDSIAPVIGVEIASSTIAGFTPSDIEFSENEIFLRFEKLGSYVPGDVIPVGQAVLNVTFISAAEPGTFVLFCIGITGIFSVRRRYNTGCPRPPGKIRMQHIKPLRNPS
jgi:hypothetical protein